MTQRTVVKRWLLASGFFVVLILVLAGIVFILNEIPRLENLFRQTGGSKTSSPLVVFLELHAQQAPNENYQIGLFAVALTNRASDPKFCVDRISLSWEIDGTAYGTRFGSASFSGRSDSLIATFSNLCNDASEDTATDIIRFRPDGSYSVSSRKDILVSLNEQSLEYERMADFLNTDWAFPLDGRQIRLIVKVSATDGNGEALHIIPQVSITSIAPHWRTNFSFPSEEKPPILQQEGLAYAELALERLQSIRFLSLFLLAALFFLITVLLFTPDLGNALEVSVGILLGLWGIREVLIPPDITVSTLIHLGIMFLYMWFALAAAIRFLGRPALEMSIQTNENQMACTSDDGNNDKTKLEQTIVNSYISTRANSQRMGRLLILAAMSIGILLYFRRNQGPSQ